MPFAGVDGQNHGQTVHSGQASRLSRTPRRSPIVPTHGCSDVDVDGLAWQGIGGVSGSEQSRPINVGHEGVAWLVAASRRSTGGEHAWVSLDIGIAYVLAESTAK